LSISKFKYDSNKCIWIPSPRKSLVSIVPIPGFGNAINGYGDYTVTFLPPINVPENLNTYFAFTSLRNSVNPVPIFNVNLLSDATQYIEYTVPDLDNYPLARGIILCGDSNLTIPEIYLLLSKLDGTIITSVKIERKLGIVNDSYDNDTQFVFNISPDKTLRVSYTTAPVGTNVYTCSPGSVIIVSGTVEIYLV